jgi:hypothetical protein
VIHGPGNAAQVKVDDALSWYITGVMAQLKRGNCFWLIFVIIQTDHIYQAYR